MAVGDNATGVKFAGGHLVLTDGTTRIYPSGTLGASDNTVPRSDGTGGFTLQSSSLVISDAGVASGITFADPSTAQQPATKASSEALPSKFHSWGATAANNSVSQRFLQSDVLNAPTANEFNCRVLAIYSGVLFNAYAHFNAADTGGANTIVIRNNGVDTAITFAVAQSATTGNDTTHTASVSPGDLITPGITQAVAAAFATMAPRLSLAIRKA